MVFGVFVDLVCVLYIACPSRRTGSGARRISRAEGCFVALCFRHSKDSSLVCRRHRYCSLFYSLVTPPKPKLRRPNPAGAGGTA